MKINVCRANSAQYKALRFGKGLLASTALATFLGLLMTQALWAEDNLQIASLGDCELDSGDKILDCQLAYRTAGKINADGSNVIVFPTWFTGNSKNLLDFAYVGSGKIADTDHYFVVIIDAFGNGLSSSPSNSQRQPDSSFPAISIRDMVTAQYRLLNEHLNINHVHAVIGASMGGMQAFEWAVSYPAFMDYVVPIEGTPWQSAYDLMLWNAQLDAIDLATKDQDSMQKSIQLLTALDGLTLWTPGFFNNMVSREKFDDFMLGFSSGIKAENLLDRRSQTVAMIQHDISAPFKEFESRAAEIITAKILIVVFDSDHMVTPGASLELAKRVGAETLLIETTCGHMAPNPDCDQPEVAAAVNEFIK
jgi:homoserine O-acetyltransferase